MSAVYDPAHPGEILADTVITARSLGCTRDRFR